MKLSKLVTICAAAAIIATPAMTESLSDRRKVKEAANAVTIEVAAGKADKENAIAVIPTLNERLNPQNITLTYLPSRGSVETADGLCDNDVSAGTLQLDVLVARMKSVDPNKTPCGGKMSIVGPGLYPYYAYAIVLDNDANSNIKSFADVVNAHQSGAAATISAGGPGSGGEAMLRNILSTNSVWQQTVSIKPDDIDTALDKLKDRQIDVAFTADGRNSPLVARIANDIDPKTNKHRFKFLVVKVDKLLEWKLSNGYRVYASVTIEDNGGWFATKTISTPAVFAVREDYRAANGKTISIIRKAVEDSVPDIATRTKSPNNWSVNFN